MSKEKAKPTNWVMDQKTSQEHGFYQKVGQEIVIHFLDGKSIKGELNGIAPYEIFLLATSKTGEVVELTIFKGSIKYIS